MNSKFPQDTYPKPHHQRELEGYLKEEDQCKSCIFPALNDDVSRSHKAVQGITIKGLQKIQDSPIKELLRSDRRSVYPVNSDADSCIRFNTGICNWSGQQRKALVAGEGKRSSRYTW
jgi:hypothetical protein